MQRFLIRDGVTREAVEAKFQALGWTCLETSDEASDVLAYKSAWAAPDYSAAASYMENTPLGCSYVFASDSAFEWLDKAFRDAGLTLGTPALLDTPLVEGPQALRTIGRMGLLAHGPLDVKLLSKLAATLLHPHPQWQRYAIYALSNTSWSEFDPVLSEAIEAHAFDPPLREFAVSMLNSLRASNWNGALYAE